MSETVSVKIGDIVEVYCPRCRLNLDANVAVVHEGTIRQVECRTCRNFVPYRPPMDMERKRERDLRRLMRMQARKRAAEQGERRPAASGASEGGTDPLRARWEDLTDGVDSRFARPYDRHRTYHAGDFLLHKRYGMGHVEQSDPDGGKMVVLFRTGLQELVQAQPRQD